MEQEQQVFNVSEYMRGLAKKSHEKMAEKYGVKEHAQRMAKARWKGHKKKIDKRAHAVLK